MSFRNVPATEDQAKAAWRDVFDRLERLENGGAIAGRVSFGDVIQIGDVAITILNGVGTQRIVQFKNILSGATSTITL